MPTDGFDELSNELDRLSKNAQKLDGTTDVSFDELFPSEFMRKNTKFDSIDEMFDESPWEIESQGDFQGLPESEFDTYVDRNTVFETWEEMQGTAGTEWVKRQLFS